MKNLELLLLTVLFGCAQPDVNVAKKKEQHLGGVYANNLQDKRINLSGVLNATYKLRTTINYTREFFSQKEATPFTKDEIIERFFSSCFAIGSDDDGTYVITAKHGIPNIDYTQKKQVSNTVKCVAKIKAITVEIVEYDLAKDEILCTIPLEEIVGLADQDVSLLRTKIKTAILNKYSLFANPELVELGDLVYSAGFPQPLVKDVNGRENGLILGKFVTNGVISYKNNSQPIPNFTGFFTESTTCLTMLPSFSRSSSSAAPEPCAKKSSSPQPTLISIRSAKGSVFFAAATRSSAVLPMTCTAIGRSSSWILRNFLSCA